MPSLQNKKDQEESKEPEFDEEAEQKALEEARIKKERAKRMREQ